MMDFIPNYERKSSRMDFVGSLEQGTCIMDSVTSLERVFLAIEFVISLVGELWRMDIIAGRTEKADLFFLIKDDNLFLVISC